MRADLQGGHRLGVRLLAVLQLLLKRLDLPPEAPAHGGSGGGHLRRQDRWVSKFASQSGAI